MPTTTLQALPYPALGDPANGPSAFQALALALEPKLVMIFATAAARTAAIPTPTEGMVTWLQDANSLELYDGSAWKVIWSTRVAYTALAVGTTSVSFSSSQTATPTINFPSNRFTVAPYVGCQIVSAAGVCVGATVLVTAVSTTSFTARVDLVAPATTTPSLHWQAVQP